MKKRIQSMGRFLSGMVMPNIGAFIAWGFLTAIFLYPGGWFPNESLSKIQPYMLNFLLPLLIAGQGGKMVGGTRGRVIASIAILGCIAQDASQYQAALRDYAVQEALFENGYILENTVTVSTTPMLMAAMIIGPFSGWIIKKFDQFMANKISAGFEMLVNNFSIGIFGLILSILGFLAISPFMTIILNFLQMGIQALTNAKAIPAIAVLLEPAKVLFLNNAINHGIFTPLGAVDVQETGKSIMYMLETNPGPGLGVLLAYWIFSNDKAAKDSAPGAVIIHFFGGIHEISFPYILANPLVILGPITGNICAITWFMFMDAGLMGPASPGSIISFILMSPKDSIWISAIGIAIATVVSFVISSLIVKFSKSSSIKEAKAKKEEMKAESIGQVSIKDSSVKKIYDIKKIIFACDAGMGSSAMGATRFAKRIKDIRPDIVVKNYAIDNIPEDADIVVCQSVLADRTLAKKPKHAKLVRINNFLLDIALDDLYNQIECLANIQNSENSKNNFAKNLENENQNESNSIENKLSANINNLSNSKNQDSNKKEKIDKHNKKKNNKKDNSENLVKDAYINKKEKKKNVIAKKTDIKNNSNIKKQNLNKLDDSFDKEGNLNNNESEYNNNEIIASSNNKKQSVVILKDAIKLNQNSSNKHEVIQKAGELLKNIGCVDDTYIAAMHDREKEVSTYLGMGIAIPHGTSNAKKSVKKSGIVFMQYPKGVSFGKEKAYLVFGIAGIGNEHLDLLARISTKLEDDTIIEQLKTTKDKQFVLDLFNNS